MDNQKTGALIATRRAELGLTQKQLAEQLHISDRTVSKWERGSGFPDISLLEPLADALDLSVVELLRGERLEEPQQEAEATIRDATRTFGARFKTTFKRLRRVLIVLAVVAALLLCLVLRLWSLGYLERWVHSEEISASEALAVCPFSLITMEEFEIVQMVLQDEALTAHLPAVYDENHEFSSEDIFEADESILSRYEGMLQIDGEPARITSLSVHYAIIHIDYRAENRRCMLSIYPFHDKIDKTCTQYSFSNDLVEALYVISNRDNRSFSMLTESSKLSQMLSK